MSHRKEQKQAETLAWVTDDEAEFWTSITPKNKSKPSESNGNLSKTTSNSSRKSLPDGVHFKFNSLSNNQLNNDFLPQQQINEKNKRIYEISQKNQEKLFQSNEKTFSQRNENHLKENEQFDQPVNNQEKYLPSTFNYSKSVEIPKTNLTFFEQLREELTKISDFKTHDSIQEKEEEDHLNHSQVNSNKQSLIDDEIPLKEKFQSFFEELTEETHVISGDIDEETFLNRRSRKAKALNSLIQQNQRLSHQQTI